MSSRPGKSRSFRNELLAAAVNCTFVADENCTPGTPLCSAKSRSSVDFARALRPAIRGPRYARGNNVQKRDATLSGEDLDPCLGKDGVPSINSSCMRLANFLQPECFGRLHVGRFKSRRRLYSGVEV